MPGIDGHAEGGLVGGGVVRDHRRDAELIQPLADDGHTDQPSPLRGHEVDRLRRHLLRSHRKVALVLPIVVVDDEYHLAVAQVSYRFFNTVKMDHFLHGYSVGTAQTNPRSRSRDSVSPAFLVRGPSPSRYRTTYFPSRSASRLTRRPSFWQETTMPVGRWVIRTAESVTFTC